MTETETETEGLRRVWGSGLGLGALLLPQADPEPSQEVFWSLASASGKREPRVSFGPLSFVGHFVGVHIVVLPCGDHRGICRLNHWESDN